MKKQTAFTLVEVLITLGAIGIVAALTIPTLMKYVDKSSQKTSFKAIYSDLSSATQMIKRNNSGLLTGFFTSLTDIKDSYANQLKITKSCDNSNTEGCWSYTWKELNGSPLTAPTTPGLILSNGAVLVFEDYFSPDCDSTGINVNSRTTYTNVCSNIVIDVNGPKIPNTIGKDIFYVWILSDFMTPWGSLKDDAKAGSIAASTTCASGDGGWGCAYKVLNNIDY